ncbi:MAG: hypothetical protein AAF493_29625, partial [Pseudomonadota bacterium]
PWWMSVTNARRNGTVMTLSLAKGVRMQGRGLGSNQSLADAPDRCRAATQGLGLASGLFRLEAKGAGRAREAALRCIGRLLGADETRRSMA